MAETQAGVRTYLGIDIAGTGQGSESGVAVIAETAQGLTYHIPEGDWSGAAGLSALAEQIRGAEQTAVDQPFSYPREMTKLLLADQEATGGAEVTAYCSRETDVAMRRLLRAHGLSSNYVMSPNRCQNIWRALALARLVGLTRPDVCLCQSPVVETHPRVAWAYLLSAQKQTLKQTIAGYKGTKKPEAEPEVRKRMLDTFELATRIRPAGGPDEQTVTRAKMAASADAIEALACAYVAYLHKSKLTSLCGFADDHTRTDTLRLEGAAVLPKHPWTLSAKDASR